MALGKNNCLFSNKLLGGALRHPPFLSKSSWPSLVLSPGDQDAAASLCKSPDLSAVLLAALATCVYIFLLGNLASQSLCLSVLKPGFEFLGWREHSAFCFWTHRPQGMLSPFSLKPTCNLQGAAQGAKQTSGMSRFELEPHSGGGAAGYSGQPEGLNWHEGWKRSPGGPMEMPRLWSKTRTSTVWVPWFHFDGLEARWGDQRL